MKSVNLLIFSKISKREKSDIYVIFAEALVTTKLKAGWSKTGGGAVPFGPGLQPPLIIFWRFVQDIFSM